MDTGSNQLVAPCIAMQYVFIFKKNVVFMFNGREARNFLLSPFSRKSLIKDALH